MLFRRHIRDVTRDMIEQLGLFRTVYLSRETVITREMLPCCKIWTPREGGPTITIGVPNFRATTDLVVQVVIEGGNDEANANYLDELCETLLLWLVESPQWQVQFEYLTNLETEIETSSEGEVRIITATITFTLQWNFLFITRINDQLATINTEVNTIGDPAGARARFVLARQP